MSDSPKPAFLQRWSKLKQAQQASSDSDKAITDTTASYETDDETPPPTPSPAPALDELTDADMPSLDSLDELSDYSVFFAKNVSENLRKQALRRLFQTPNFKQRDGLDDYDEDYTQFTALGDTFTIDMQHQQNVDARRRREQPDEFTYMQSNAPRQAALDSLQDHTAIGSVEYHSQGRVLLIGAEPVLQLVARLDDALQPHVLLTQPTALAQGQSFISALQNRHMELQGWLGAFTLQLHPESGASETLQADLVLDMHSQPLLDNAVTPPGYYRLDPQASEEHISAVLSELQGLVGQFAKPRFFDYDPSICAHGGSGQQACTRCLDACPTEAIISIGDKIQVEPHLWQGGGTCATVCPTGAIRYNYPSAAHQVDQLRRMLRAYHEAGGRAAKVLFHRAERELDIDALPANILPFPVEELASVGAEVWVTALSFGAQQVCLYDEPNTPSVSREQLQAQLAIAQHLLSGMGYAADALVLSDTLPTTGGITQTIKAATQAGLSNKRQQYFTALDHLYAQAPDPQDEIPLPDGAPFGRLQVDSEGCTLCMACVSLCPAQALSGGTDRPQLRFFAENCVQCGLCATACPEQVIQLEPVYITQREQRQQAQLLHEEAPFECIRCGKAFASQRMITNMLGKLQSHPMFQGERALQRLKMCEDCRVVDVVQDNEAMGQPSLSVPKRH